MTVSEPCRHEDPVEVSTLGEGLVALMCPRCHATCRPAQDLDDLMATPNERLLWNEQQQRWWVWSLLTSSERA